MSEMSNQNFENKRHKPFHKAGKPVRGYRQRMFREWRDRGLFESTEQSV